MCGNGDSRKVGAKRGGNKGTIMNERDDTW